MECYNVQERTALLLVHRVRDAIYMTSYMNNLDIYFVVLL